MTHLFSPEDMPPGAWRLTARSTARLLTVLGGVVATGLASGLLVASGVSRWTELRAVPTAAWAPDQMIGVLARLGAGLLLGWLAISTTLAIVATVPTAAGAPAARLAGRLAPRLLRSMVAAAVGGSMAFASAAAADASPTSVGWPAVAATASAQPSTDPSSSPGLTGLPGPGWTPDPPPTPPPTRSADVSLVSTAGAAKGTGREPVVVRRGDTLWAVAARHLGPGADAAQIAREWPRWYAENRAVVGDNPDLLQPGQLLTPPTRR